MHRGRNYSEDLIDNVITLFDEGLTSTQVAKIINKRFKSEALGRFTRCSALSIKFRKGKCEKSNRNYYYPPRRSYGYTKSLALNELQDRKTEQDEINLSKDRLQLALRG